MKGKFKSIDNRTITFQKDDDTEGTIIVANGALITLNGKKAKLDELEEGDELTFNGDPATSVAATR